MIDVFFIKFLEWCFDNFEKYVKVFNGMFVFNVNWYGNYDVIVLGFGGVGVLVVCFVVDNGVYVLVVDVVLFGCEGGNICYFV